MQKTPDAFSHLLLQTSSVSVKLRPATKKGKHGVKRSGSRPSHGPGDVGGVLFGLHAQHGDAGRAALELRLALEGVVVVVAVGGRREQRVGAEEVVEGDVAELALLVGEADVAVVGAATAAAGGRAGRVGVGGDAGGRAAGQHAGGDHGSAGGRAGPQVVGELLTGRRKREDFMSDALNKLALKQSRWNQSRIFTYDQRLLLAFYFIFVFIIIFFYIFKI